MIKEAVLLSVVYLIVYILDPSILSWQALNRPIVISSIVGAVLGDFKLGIIMGASLESIFMGISAIGGQIPADATTASIIAVAYTILTGSTTEAGVALSLPIGTAIAAFNALFTPVWASLVPHWEKTASIPKRFMIENIIVSVLMGLIPSIIIFISVAFGVQGLNNFLSTLPEWVMKGLNASASMLIGVGFAILTSMIWEKEIGYFFIFGYVLAKYLELHILAIAMFGIVVAITIFIQDKKLIDLKNSLLKQNVQSMNTNSILANDEEDFFND